ncbi:MAG: hypothetical protein A2161_11215 [Candidatus Schekmanbacteria bacterium RBG_13_48_7]|uniref:Uncharacterized protein n=1 Tax=Candidatus Schekmanbacteria bacterium RBG_13_48_7 TaxID=1817878 RepID=A0A1F7S505_9BACT|nr:MAG: hypothetical protein A2161_11215 [Candidatus Schekmanbacteria bacterium RBG_13_48_7]
MHFEGDALHEPQLDEEPEDFPPPAMTLEKLENSFSTSFFPHFGQIISSFPQTIVSNSLLQLLQIYSKTGIF